jgi:DUF2934 family protein
MSQNPASIAELAYQLWVRRGSPEGSDELDWLEAERQLAGAGSSAPAASEAGPNGEADSSPETTFPTSDPLSGHLSDTAPTDADENWHDTDTAATSAPEGRPRARARARKS